MANETTWTRRKLTGSLMDESWLPLFVVTQEAGKRVLTELPVRRAPSATVTYQGSAELRAVPKDTLER